MQWGPEQLEPPDMRLALNKPNMAKGGVTCVTVEETQYLIKKPRAKIQQEMMPGAECPG
jgi:hypothetical protein